MSRPRRRQTHFRPLAADSLMRPQLGWGPASLRVTMADFLEALAVLHRTEGTRRGHGKRLLVFARWAEERGLASPGEVTSALVERYQRHLFYVRKPNGQPLSVGTQRLALTTLQSYFRWCTRRHLIPANPAADLELPRLGRQLPRYCLSFKEVTSVLARPRVSTVSGLRDRAILEVLWAAALRRSEVAHLRLHDVRINNGTLFVHQGKGRKDRVVPLSASAVNWVQRYLDESRPRLWVPPETGFLFLLDTGFPLTVDLLSQKVRMYLDEAGISAPGSCHLFRHASATALLEGGADVRYVQEFLGHANLQTTQVYTHVTLTKLKAVYEACHPSARTKSSTEVTPSYVPTAADVLQALEEEPGDEVDE